MLYYLALALRPKFGALNVFTYHTVRAGCAAVTAFLLCLLFGPALIRRLRGLDLGQHIRKDHVENLHALHNHKAGTPTMGGALIIVAAVCSLFLWSDPFNRLLAVATAVLCALALVGFIDDYIGLRRKRNRGLSAKAKFTGQILVGSVLGAYLYFTPVTADRPLLALGDVRDWAALAAVMRDGALAARCPKAQHLLDEAAFPPTPDSTQRTQILAALNAFISRLNLYDEGNWGDVTLSPFLKKLIETGQYATDKEAMVTANRQLLADAYPAVFTSVTPDLHTKVEIPGLKKVFIPLGILYVVFVVLVIVGSSNAVNLTDGLDGLAAGASIISLLAYTGIAYIVSRADWSEYLYLIYVPEASELAVFGAAMLGAGMGFLWFNSHPAEVFMGDTGSLALGGAIGTLAILTKQELLLICVGGLFVIEAASVIIQVTSYKMRGKRVFKMAPLHHHFELSGWSESKVVIRFWIIALLFALLSLGTLKLR
ncbi:MAG TPA: phospho-N-acetylmuramoyl-pentapeptide-transferase [Candidatus Hydrogenedentes bacterium]|nr:phospho-N-acetylmuramoyl-pentapeptide-transferase [Candidatus Hydrogenedentota bacterium]